MLSGYKTASFSLQNLCFYTPKNTVLGRFKRGKEGKIYPKTHKQLIISPIHNRKILAFLRAKNELNDFVDTLAKLLPIS